MDTITVEARRRRRPIPWLAAITSLALVAAGCGDDDTADPPGDTADVQGVADTDEPADDVQAPDPPDDEAGGVPEVDTEECPLIVSADVSAATGIAMAERDPVLPPGLEGIEGAPVVCEFEIDPAGGDDHSSVSVMYTLDPPDGFFLPPEDSVSAGLGDDSFMETGSWQEGEDSHCRVEVLVGEAQVSVNVSFDTDAEAVSNGDACHSIAEHVLDRI